ncbi:MAG: alpha/beta fold hydrolase [Candidatus Dormibacteraeota bacterium]|nr:alpha/beta fold hydrolase [Candidatus Dormibacteraeota bacterium]
MPAYEVVGEGAPLVLLPGTFSDRRVWHRVLGSLQRRHRCLLYDPRGTGRTPDPGTPFGVDDLADDVLGLMDQVGWARADLVGHSLGSATAVTIAGRHPSRVRRLVAVAPAVGVDGHLEIVLDHWEALARSDLDDRALARALVLDAFGREAFDRLVPAVIDDWVRHPIARDTILRFVACDRAQDVAPMARRVDAPTLILAGDEDALAGTVNAERLAALVSGARVEVIRGSGHTPQIERPSAVVRVLAAFLDG